MEYENVLVDLDGPVATITLNRPEKLNAISRGLMVDLRAALVELGRGDAVRVIRVKGAGRAFCPGYDLSPGGNLRDPIPGAAQERDGSLAGLGESSIALDRDSLRWWVDQYLWIWNYRKPIIGQTHNYCLSGALDMIGMFDIVFAAEGTRFGHPAARGLGVIVTVGMLPMKIGAAATKELMFTGDQVTADEAKQLGIIQHVVAADELDEKTMAFCQRVALMPLDSLTMHKHLINRWSELQNVRVALYEGADFDAIYHISPSGVEFGRRAGEEGLRAALAWRDNAYATGPAAEHDAANRPK
jgi:enoyl-CoA hydratase